MRIGVIYPQTEYGTDPAAIRDYAQTADSGFDSPGEHLRAIEGFAKERSLS